MSQARIVEIVTQLAEPLATQLGYELVDVEYGKSGPDWILRCMIDCETGIGVNECQRFSEAVGKLLDEADPIPGSYLLEVSSPGIERPLKKDRDFVRFTGKSVEVKLAQPINNKKVYQGLLTEVLGEPGSQSMKVIIESDGETIEIPRTMITKAHLIEEIFNPKKGGHKKK